MPGLIATQLRNAEHDQSNSFVGMDADTINVDPRSTVQQQVADITSRGSPILKLAESKATAGMNRRGLINSSMALGAAQRAVTEAALPIAQQDAGTYFDAQKTNQAATNRAREVTVDATNKAADISGRLMAEKSLSKQNFGQDIELQKLRGSQQKELDEIAARNQRIITNSQNAALVFANTQQAINSILGNTEWTGEVKRQMLDKLMETTNAQLATISAFNDIDVSGLLNFNNSAAQAPTTQSQVRSSQSAPAQQSAAQPSNGAAPAPAKFTPVTSIASEDDLRQYIAEAKSRVYDPGNANETAINQGEASTILGAAMQLDLPPSRIAEITGEPEQAVVAYIKKNYPTDMKDYIEKHIG